MGRASSPARLPKQVSVAQELVAWDAGGVWESVHVETLLTRAGAECLAWHGFISDWGVSANAFCAAGVKGGERGVLVSMFVCRGSLYNKIDDRHRPA